MRERKFRAKSISKNEWVYGLPYTVRKEIDSDDLIWRMSMLRGVHTKIYPNTLGDYTGLKDKNVKEIYEGDICQADHDFGPGGFQNRIFEVKFCSYKGYQWNYWDMKTIEIIGNNCENPEILLTDDQYG